MGHSMCYLNSTPKTPYELPNTPYHTHTCFHSFRGAARPCAYLPEAIAISAAAALLDCSSGWWLTSSRSRSLSSIDRTSATLGGGGTEQAWVPAWAPAWVPASSNAPPPFASLHRRGCSVCCNEGVRRAVPSARGARASAMLRRCTSDMLVCVIVDACVDDQRHRLLCLHVHLGRNGRR